jgi:RNA polymerase sigma factor (sigma-70 family)
MDSHRFAPAASSGIEILFEGILRGKRGQKLRTQLVSMHPGRSREEIEEALQAACKQFVDKAEGISAPGQVYTWLRTTAHRLLSREAGYEGHELPADPTAGALLTLVDERPGPEEQAIADENEADLARLAHEVTSSLPERRRNVLALHTAGCKRPEIAARLGLPERTVKYDLYEIMEEARAALARLSGGGCERGEPLVLRLACGLATSAEAAQTRLHVSQCRRCATFNERLGEWREKAGALLPAPTLEAASPGLLGRFVHRAADGLASVKQQVLGGATQLKQQASASYYRAVDPTPLAGARPGTLAAVVAGCLAIGGGAAGYCAQQDVDPFGAVGSLFPEAEKSEPNPTSPPPESAESTPSLPSEPVPASEEPIASEPAPPASEQEPASEPPPPPPEQSFEPASPDYPATESSAEYQAPESVAPKPAAVPAGEAPQFGGP